MAVQQQHAITALVSALEYMDNNLIAFAEFYDRVERVIFNTESHYPWRALFIDEHEDGIYECEIDVIGTYFVETHVWVWAWADPAIPRTAATISRDIWKYAGELEQTEYALKMELVTSRSLMINHIQLDMNLALASYLSKHPLVYIFQSSSNVFELNKATFDPETDNESIVYFIILRHETATTSPMSRRVDQIIQELR